jgi:hypothetical protein
MEFPEIEFNEKSIFIGIFVSFLGVMIALVFLEYVLMPQINYLSGRYVFHRMSVEEFQTYNHIMILLMFFGYLSIFIIPPFVASYTARYRGLYSSAASSLIIGVFFSMLYIIANHLIPQTGLFTLTAVISLLHVPGGIFGYFLSKRKANSHGKQINIESI